MLELFELTHSEAIYVEFRAVADELLGRGIDHYSADGILHVVRFHRAIGSRDSDGYKVNNNLSSQFARRLASEDVRFAGFFEFRKSKHDGASA